MVATRGKNFFACSLPPNAWPINVRMPSRSASIKFCAFPGIIRKERTAKKPPPTRKEAVIRERIKLLETEIPKRVPMISGRSDICIDKQYTAFWGICKDMEKPNILLLPQQGGVEHGFLIWLQYNARDHALFSLKPAFQVFFEHSLVISKADAIGMNLAQSAVC